MKPPAWRKPANVSSNVLKPLAHNRKRNSMGNSAGNHTATAKAAANAAATTSQAAKAEAAKSEVADDAAAKAASAIEAAAEDAVNPGDADRTKTSANAPAAAAIVESLAAPTSDPPPVQISLPADTLPAEEGKQTAVVCPQRVTRSQSTRLQSSAHAASDALDRAPSAAPLPLMQAADGPDVPGVAPRVRTRRGKSALAMPPQAPEQAVPAASKRRMAARLNAAVAPPATTPPRPVGASHTELSSNPGADGNSRRRRRAAGSSVGSQ